MKAEELRIKPSDLRLGNWVMYDNRYFQISMIADVFPELNTTEFGIGVVDYNNISAIPLSEEVLLRSGFHKCEKHENFYQIILNDWTKIYVAFHEKQYAVELSISKHSFCPKVNYLHQLQNLYYTLTGEEMEVSL